MSHGLLTPLNAIIGFAEILRDEILGAVKPEQKELVTDIHTSGRHLLDMINDKNEILSQTPNQYEKLETDSRQWTLELLAGYAKESRPWVLCHRGATVISAPYFSAMIIVRK